VSPRALLASPLGFLIGLSLGALGGGGSILAVPVLVYAAGQGARDATTSSLVLVGIASLIGVVPHWRAGRVRLGTGLMFGLVGVGGSLAGSACNRRLDPDALLLGFSVLVVIAAWRMLTACPTCTKVGEQHELQLGTPPERGRVRTRTRLTAGQVLLVVAAGSGVGFLTGLFGVGGGFVIVPALTLVLKMPMPEAIGTSLVAITVNTVVALAARLATSSIDWAITLPFAIAAVAGVIVGGNVADRLDPERSLKAFASLLVAVAIYTATSAIVALT
jgi:uncharacterized membrane protein YfcA